MMDNMRVNGENETLYEFFNKILAHTEAFILFNGFNFV